MPKKSISVLVVGKTGQLAHALARSSLPDDWRVTFADRNQIDLAKPDAAAAVVRGLAPDLVINAAAYTAVDAAESEPELARLINCLTPAAVAGVCASRNVPFVTVSTDYVFDGTRLGPYRESDPVAPLGVYGSTKEEGERLVRSAWSKHLIFRTSWVFSATGTNFVRTMLRYGKEREVLRVVADQRGKPTAASDLASAILMASQKILSGGGAFGTYHIANADVTTWNEFAQTIFENARHQGHPVPTTVEAISTAEYPTRAKRPANSELDTSKFTNTFGFEMRSWKLALPDVLDELLRQSASAAG
jgi:dTDP-4-dehydrorhamnose reductase